MDNPPEDEGVEVDTVGLAVISYSSSDRDAAERLGERLCAEAFAALFLDFDPEQGIPAGRNWERELYAQLRKTDAVIFLASTASVASRWCLAEVNLARLLGKPVVPLRLDGDAWLELLNDTQWVDLAKGERGYTRGCGKDLGGLGWIRLIFLLGPVVPISVRSRLLRRTLRYSSPKTSRWSDRWKLSEMRTTKSVATQPIHRLRLRGELKECGALN